MSLETINRNGRPPNVKLSQLADQWGKEELRRMINEHGGDWKRLEFRDRPPDDSDAELEDFLAEVSSFANGEGGEIVFGISQNNDGPPRVLGLTMANVEHEIQRLGAIIHDGIDPPIENVEIRKLELANSLVLLVVHLNRSRLFPHVIVLDCRECVYSRGLTGKYRMEIHELRAALALNQDYLGKVRDFKADRIATIASGRVPISLPESPRLVLHLLPVSSFTSPRTYAIEKIVNYSLLVRPVCQGIWNERFNLEGFLTSLGDGPDHGVAYTQLFKNGAIEVVDASPQLTDGSLLLPFYYERALVDCLPGQLAALKQLEIEPPLVLYLTLLGAKGYRIASMISVMGFSRKNCIGHRDVLNTPEIILDDYGRPAAEVLKPAFDSIWNACGFPHSLNYSAAGEWRVR